MKRNKKGFTIVELVIVIGVIGILSAILIPTFVTLTARAQEAAMKSECASAFSAYAAEAVDGKFEVLNEQGQVTASYEIVFKKQDEIRLYKDSAVYTFNEANGWHKDDSFSVPTSADNGILVIANQLVYSTFNGYAFYTSLPAA